jgi:hypothetical protein
MKICATHATGILNRWTLFLGAILTIALMVPFAAVSQSTVIYTDPDSAATGVALNKHIAATFSQTMDTLTITTATFTLMQGTTSVSGSVSRSGTIATFVPASNLVPNTAYTATITTGAKNLAGIALANNFVWHFTTGTAVVVNPPPPVNLGTAGNFTLLAKTGISATGVTSITGDIGVSPIAATGITGFGLIMDHTGTFSISSLVTGNVYAADYTDPTPTKMTTAIGDMQTAYTDAAGRSTPDFTELYAGDVTGKTLTSGLYKWSTGVLISAAGVTISGSASDVWIFQIAQNLELADGAIVTLSGSAQASNIFWQVAGQVTLGTTAAMKGIILCQTAIVMSTGAKLNGRALAQAAVTLDANTVIKPAIAGTSVQNGLATTQKYAFFQKYLKQSIEFTVPTNGRTTLKILNALGQEVATVFNGEAEAGKYNRVQFNESRLTKGVYFLKLECNGIITTKKMLLIK